MTVPDRSTLERVVPSSVGQPDWDDVLSRVRALEGRRRRRAGALVGVALVVALGAASAFGTVRDLLFDKDPSVVSIVCKGVVLDKPVRDASGRLTVARGRFLLRIAFVNGISDRGRFVDYSFQGRSGPRLIRVLRGAKGTIELTFTPGPPDNDWRITKGTGTYAGVRGSGGEAGHYGPWTVNLEMAGEFRR